FSFKYSPRPGTKAAEQAAEQAADAGGAVAPEEAQRRLEALQAVQRELTLDYHRSRVGSVTRILVEGDSRRGAGQLCGRDPQHRVVNLSCAETPGRTSPNPGDLVDVEVVEATPHSLIGALRAEAPVGGGDAGGFRTLRVKLGPPSADVEDGGAAPGIGSARR
ncbi:MAG: TRAM domain-containing protein, partial [Deltaproteobacteria bacterium]|nr:TRAM domain-containing protein [Deltaproteobacteria bacterium]